MSKESPTAKKKKAKNIQRATIGIMVFIGIIAIAMMASPSDKVDTSNSQAQLTSHPTIDRAGRNDIKIRDKRVEVLQNKDQAENVKKAKKENKAASVIAPVPITFSPVVGHKTDKVQDNTVDIKNMSAGEISGGKAGEQQKQNMRLLSIQKELGMFTKLLKPAGPMIVKASSDKKKRNAYNNGTQDTQNRYTDVAKADPSVDKTGSKEGYDGHKFNAGDIVYGVTDIGVMTDDAGPVRFTVLSGPAKGAIMVGSYKMANSRSEAVTMKIDKVQFANETFTIDAYVLNGSTYRPGIASKVDHHYFERWGSFVGAAFISSVGDVMRETGNQVTSTVGAPAGTTPTVTSTPTYTPSQRGWIIGSNVADKLSPIIEKNFNRPNTILVNPNEPVVIMFMDSVVFPKKKTKQQ